MRFSASQTRSIGKDTGSCSVSILAFETGTVVIGHLLLYFSRKLQVSYQRSRKQVCNQTRSITVHPVVSDREVKPATEYVSAHPSSQFIQHHSYHDAVRRLSNYRALYAQYKCFFVERLLEVLGFDLEICWDSWMRQID